LADRLSNFRRTRSTTKIIVRFRGSDGRNENSCRFALFDFVAFLMDNLDTRRSTEPLSIAAGDTVKFTRQLPKYSAASGWTVEYIGIGGGSQIIWNATTNVDGVSFDVNIPTTTTLQYVAGDYVLEGFASNGATGERFQFYYGSLNVGINFQAVGPDQDTKTYAQKGIEKCQALLLKMLDHDINDSSTEGAEFRRKKVEEVNKQLDEFTRIRENELQKEAALNGKPSRKKIKQVLLVTDGRFGLNQFGAGNNIGNFD